MLKRLLVVALFIAFTFLLVGKVGAGTIVFGTVVLDDTWTWDFSESSDTSPLLSCDPDIMIALGVTGAYGDYLGDVVAGTCPPNIIIALPDSSFEDLRYAPADTMLYDWYCKLEIETSYVVRTNEYHYAKFRFTHIPPGDPVMDFAYQTDGSTKLFDEIGTETSTWGAIKALCR